MGIESKINTMLSSTPIVKKTVKRLYQLGMYAISPKIKSEGDIKRITPIDDNYEYFFGYYDKSPWDITDRYMLCLRVKNTTKESAPSEPADIILIDTHNSNSYEVLATTRTWNVQQGTMLQWVGPSYDEEIIYNDYRNGQYCSVILNVFTKEERVIDRPVYTVATNGEFALSLDFSRLHRMRPGYGYSNLEEITKSEKIPVGPCIWSINLKENTSQPVLSYTDFFNFETRDNMKGAEHKVNHIMLNPSGTRFMVLHRWLQGSKKYTRLVTANVDGSDMFNLSDDNMTSHCFWKNDEEIIAYSHKKETANGYYLMTDKTNDYSHVWQELKSDGHPSFSADGKYAITDTYPDKARIARVFLIHNGHIKTLAKVFAPFKYDNDFRCDLHPRWNRESNKVCFDSVFEGKRGLYTVKID